MFHRAIVPSPGPEVQPFRTVTLRALTVGLLLVIVADLWCIHAETIARTSRINATQFPVSFAAPFVLLILVLNPGLATLRRTWALTPNELLVVLGMGLVGAVIPCDGLTSQLLGMLATPFYYASPENQWGLYFLDYIPLWLAPRNTDFALTYLFEGLPPGASIPWRIWLIPLFWWGTLIVAVVAFSLGIAVILRRQWAEHERLVYPLLRPAVALIERTHPNTLWPNLALTRLFWAGFALTFGISAWNILVYFFPVVPSIPRLLVPGGWLYLTREIPPIWASINFYTFGFGYFANQDVLLGFWVFSLLLDVEVGLLRRVGYEIGGAIGTLGYLGRGGGYWGNAENAWQCFGALTFLVLWGLYIARRHLIDVVRKVCRPGRPLDDTGEMLSYRAAVCCTVIGLAYTFCWFYAAGLEFRMLLPYLFALLVVHIGLARFVAEAGVLYAYSPMSPQEFMVRVSGTASVSAPSMTLLTFSFVICGNAGRGFLLPTLAQVARIDDLIRGQGRRLFAAVALALLVALITSVLATLYIGYTYGAANSHDYAFFHSPPTLFNRALSLITGYPETDQKRLVSFGIGGGLMALLTYLRYRLPWWPLHPIGLPMSGAIARNSFMSIVLIWGVKSILLRVGGVTLYRRGVPFFVGIIAGHAVAVLLSHCVDQIWFPGQGHVIHSFGSVLVTGESYF